MRVTRGDNWAFLFLPAITIFALAGTFIVGKLAHFTVLENEIILYLNDREDIPIIYCDDQMFEASNLGEGVWKTSSKDCSGLISIRVNDNLVGTCEKVINDFARIEINIKSSEKIEMDCIYFK